jgi:WD40 repeat protein
MRDEGGTVQLWDVANRHAPTRTALVPDDNQAVTAVAFSPDGHTPAAATGGGGGTVQLWDVKWGVAISGHLHDWSCGAAGGGLPADEWEGLAPGIPYRPSC